MTREKFAWLLGIVMIAGMAMQMPRVLAHRDDDYNFARTLIDIHRQVMTNYVEQPDDFKLQQGAIDGMLSQLDPFTTYVPPANQENFDSMLEGSFKGVGVQLDKTENGDIQVISPIDNTPAARAGVEAGDIIVKVNGEEIHNMRFEEVSRRVRGKVGTSVTLTVRHDDGTVQDLPMVRDDIVVPTIKGLRRRLSLKTTYDDSWDFWASNDPKIAYIRIVQFTADTYPSLKKVLQRLLDQGMKGLILDVRFNPGGMLDQAKDIVNLFVKEGVIVKVKGRNRPEEITNAKPDGALPLFPMIVLVNDQSASASEIVAGSLKDNKRALIVGQRTYGKGSVQELIKMEGNSGELKLTVAYYYLPSGRCVHKKKDATDWGVDPQLPILMDVEQEKELRKQQFALDLISRPATTQSTTVPATNPAIAPTSEPGSASAPAPASIATAPSTGPTTTTGPSSNPATTTASTADIDPQLTAAIEVLITDIRGPKTIVPAVPATTQAITATQADTTTPATATQSSASVKFPDTRAR